MEWQNWLDKKVLDHGKQRKTDDFADPDKSLLLDTEPDKTIPQIKEILMMRLMKIHIAIKMMLIKYLEQ